MKRNLIIFGAGASYGAGDAVFGWSHNPVKKVPALGNKLFSELQSFSPQIWGRLDKKLVTEFENDFEKGMQLLAISNPYAMGPLQRVMAEYFFNFRPMTSNLYVRLAEKIKNSKWRGTLVTLNYERLLEMALSHVGLKPVCAKLTQETDKIEICFPHGCCHFFCDSAMGVASMVSFAGSYVKTNGAISSISDPKIFFPRIQTDAFPPVMSYFDPKKETTSGQNFIEQQKMRLKDLINEADNIAVIGVRVRPNDFHIWDCIEKTNARVIYCGGKQGGEEYEIWKNNKRTKYQDVVIFSYFNEAFDELCTHLNILM